MIKLGDYVKDKVSELEGTVVADTNYLYGCRWVCVVPKNLENGLPQEFWMDEQRAEVVNQEVEEVVPEPESEHRWRGGGRGSFPSRSFPKGG